jgi:ubiquinone/menaquinone biosynthesis C-methylase UbiE
VTQWYEESFGRDYLALYPHRNVAEARANVAGILELIAPPRDAPLLDLCCGAGRHLQALHEAGFSDLTGIDLSQHLLDVAGRRLKANGATKIRLLRSDMRRIPFRERFETILSLFTSFGYFSEIEEDEAVLRAAYGALRPGGTFLIDTLDRPWTVSHLTPHGEETIDGIRVATTREISPDGLRVEKEIRIEPPGEPPKVYRESVRMYVADELRAMLERSGFVDLHFHGALDGRPYDSTHPRMIAIARRPTQREIA